MNIFDKIIDWFGCDEGYTVRKPEEPKKLSINQPIIEFVELMKKDIKRFNVIFNHNTGRVSITDLKTKLTIEYRSIRFFAKEAYYSRTDGCTDWLTYDELTLINNTLIESAEKRSARIAKVREWQNKRNRNKWVNVYCNNLEAK